MTFEESLNSKTASEQQLDELQRSFAPTVAELQAIRNTIQRAQPSWSQRLASIEQRRQPALSRRIADPNLETIIRELTGDGIMSGILYTVRPQVEGEIHQLEHIPKHILGSPQTYLPWYNRPQNARALVGRIEALLTKAEALVKDGSDLHRMVAHRAGHPDPVTILPSSRPSEPDVQVEV